MNATNVCPKCDKNAEHLLVQPMEGKVQVENGRSLHIIAFLCPHCHATMGAQVDPISIMTDTINNIIAKLAPK